MPKNTIKKYKRKKERLHQKGLTLMELVTVMFIIGILVSIALPRYTQLMEKSRTSEAKSVLGSILNSQRRYAFEYDVYASSMSDLDIGLTTGKHFSFALIGATAFDASNNETIARAQRINSPLSYNVDITELGDIVSPY